jgi:hypothetical protein
VQEDNKSVIVKQVPMASLSPEEKAEVSQLMFFTRGTFSFANAKHIYPLIILAVEPGK